MREMNVKECQTEVSVRLITQNLCHLTTSNSPTQPSGGAGVLFSAVSHRRWGLDSLLKGVLTIDEVLST